MNNINQLYIELLVSAVQSSGFVHWSIPSSVFETYLELKGRKDEIMEGVKSEYHGITKSYFEKSINLDDRQQDLDTKVNSFKDILARAESIGADEIDLSSSQTKALLPAYDFYCSKTGHKRNYPFRVHRLSSSSFSKLEGMVEQIGKAALELKILHGINDHLAFSEEYLPIEDEVIEKKSVDRVADACWEVFNSNNDIHREELVDTVLKGFRFERYADLSPRETNRKVKKTAKQWVRDNEDDLQIK